MKLPDPTTSNAVLQATRAAGDRATAERLAATARRGMGEGGDGSLTGLKRAANQFEALFYNQLLKSMRATVPENGFWGQSSGTKIYRQLHDQELATRLADQGGLGIADLIVEQFAPAVAREGEQAHAPMAAVSRRRGLQRYGVAEGADLVRLRRLAADVGGAAADTLGRHERDLVAAARQAGVASALVLAVTVRESAGDPAAVSPRGARGLMQLMPGTAAEVGVSDADDPAQNLRGGARYLARMLDRYEGDLDLALAAYNAGPGAVDRAGRRVPPYPETRDYVAAVKDLAARLGLDTGTNLVKRAQAAGPPAENAR